MRHAVREDVFQDVRKGPVSQIVHKDSRLDGFNFRVEDENPFRREAFDGHVCQVVCAERVQKARVLCAGVNQSGKSQLPDAVQSLEVGMPDDFAEQPPGHFGETVDGVVDDETVGHAVFGGGGVTFRSVRKDGPPFFARGVERRPRCSCRGQSSPCCLSRVAICSCSSLALPAAASAKSVPPEA